MDRILTDQAPMATLREWTSIARPAGSALVSLQQAMAADILTTIDATDSRR